MEIDKISQSQLLDLATRALNGQKIGGQNPTENHQHMAKMMCRPLEEGGVPKTTELLPEGSFTALRLTESTTPNDFFQTHAIILNTPIDVMGRPVFVGADAVDGIFFLRAKTITDDISKIMTPVVSDNTKNAEATSILKTLLHEGKVEQVVINGLLKTAVDGSAKAALERGEKDVSIGLNKEDRLKVLKLFFTPINIESDFKCTVDGAGSYNVFTRQIGELDDQIKAIRGRYNDEADPMKKHTIRIQLEIIEKFREKRVNWEDSLTQGTNWQNWLQDKRGITNRSNTKFNIRKDVVYEYSNKLTQESERIKIAAKNRAQIDIKQLEIDVISRTVDMAFLSYIQNAKFDIGLKPIRN